MLLHLNIFTRSLKITFLSEIVCAVAPHCNIDKPILNGLFFQYLSFLTLIIYFWIRGVGTNSRIQIKQNIYKSISSLLSKSFYYFVLLKIS